MRGRFDVQLRTALELALASVLLLAGACGSSKVADDDPSADAGDASCTPGTCSDGWACVRGQCVEEAADTDGDGLRAAFDCNDEDPQVGRTATIDCSTDCGNGTRACSDGTWGECDAPTDCVATCTEEDERTAACGQCGTRPEVCRSGSWVADGECVEEEACPCEPGWGDCDDDPRDGCETRLDTAMNCGGCNQACAPPRDCETGEPVCILEESRCTYALADAMVVCRSAAGPCDVSETCTGDAPTCPADAEAEPGTTCRASECGDDEPEVCEGAPLACGAACGCHGQPCCRDSDCGADLYCYQGTCLTCPPVEVGASGSFTAGSSSDALASIRLVTAMGDTLVFRDNLGGVGTITLSGFTASGTYMTGGSDDVTTTVQGSGNNLTFRSSGGTFAVITLEGAAVSGAFFASAGEGVIASIDSVNASGGVLTFGDLTGRTGNITLVAELQCF